MTIRSFRRLLSTRTAASDWIFIEGVTTFGRHGVFDEEKRLGQRFVVDVKIRLNLRAAARSDSVEDTVDYAKVFATVQRIIRGEAKNTVEAVAGQIADEILTGHEKPEEVVVRVAKPYVALDGNLKSVGVELRRLRDLP
mmetsp:Transcript_19338/g.28037  ORF Transcript_19338/g.28037 Transcript_19338/m.28037 type:complete len:139 (-) Transcript_19338:450-866(-)